MGYSINREGSVEPPLHRKVEEDEIGESESSINLISAC
jgi:hypothetical protein